MKIVLFLILLLVVSCATRTLYQPHNESGGYSDTTLKDNIQVARFSGNARTNIDDANIFAIFRSIEICYEKGFKVSKILKVDNKTSSETIQKSSSNNYREPTYFSGNSNTNTNYNNFGNSNSNTSINGTAYGGSVHSNSTSWNETYYYPTFDAYFSCYNEIYLAQIELKIISAEEIKEFTKDRLGGLQIIKIDDQSPNQGIFQIGDILIRINNIRVLEVNEISREIDSAKDKNNIQASIIREGKPLTIKFKTNNVTEKFILANSEIIRRACSVKEVKTRPICADRIINQ
ncbi:PDZ domain-containing protein [Fluviispira multicolorata]|uniref:PDZ domain-containing protein n=1 Tax=Fluviispira multicolorata TaxID=2654512 RepID=A0A833JBG5_9BACT|nr:PDZ domain-containing protein [Fluviispira multicolorata]KAB8029237.1 hypothetical protein GCL57_11930 [Fluviispira multicolorata]